MASELSGVTREVAALALRMRSAAKDASTFLADLGEELPVIKPVLLTLKAIHEKVETVKDNREELAALEERCNDVTACFVIRSRGSRGSSPSLEMVDVRALEDCVEVARRFIERCGGRGRVSRVMKASSDKNELAGLNARIDRLIRDLGLRGIAAILVELDQLKAMLVSESRCARQGLVLLRRHLLCA